MHFTDGTAVDHRSWIKSAVEKIKVKTNFDFKLILIVISLLTTCRNILLILMILSDLKTVGHGTHKVGVLRYCYCILHEIIHCWCSLESSWRSLSKVQPLLML